MNTIGKQQSYKAEGKFKLQSVEVNLFETPDVVDFLWERSRDYQIKWDFVQICALEITKKVSLVFKLYN